MTVQKYFSRFKRSMALFLACLCIVTAFPLQAFAADEAPNSIKITNVPSMSNGACPGFGTTGLLHIIEAALPNGEKEVAFCGDHSKSLNGSHQNQTWTYTRPIDDDLICALLTWYYHQFDTGNWSGGSPWDTKDTKDTNPIHAQHNAWVQACVWQCLKNPGRYAVLMREGDYNLGVEKNYGYSDSSWALLKEIGTVYMNAIKTVRGWSSLDLSYVPPDHPYKTDPVGHCASQVASILTLYQQGGYPTMGFAMYSNNNANVQPMITRYVPDDTQTEPPIWAKIRKVDEDGKPLSGATFQFSFSVATGTERVAGSATTGADGWAVIQISQRVLSGATTATISAKETKAPSGYTLVPGPYSATGNSTDNGTRETAVDLSPGGVTNPKGDGDGGDGDVLKKVDARTKQGVGPATFHFEGQANPNEGADMPLALMSDDGMSVMSASSVQYASGSFEMEVAGSTGFAPRDLQVTLADGSKGTLKAGTAFTIMSEEGANWKFKTSEKNGSMEGTVAGASCMINLPDVLPSIEYDILNASSAKYAVGSNPLDGVTGQNLYGNLKMPNARLGRDEYIVPIMYDTAKKWAAVQNALASSGDGLIFYDAYRPFEVQQKVKTAVDLVENKPGYKELLTDSNGWGKNWFISQKVSNHQRGTAADVGLKSARDSMPSQIHDLSINAVVYNKPSNNPSESDLKASVKNNPGAMKLHTTCMNAGLSPLASEWWHFDDDATQQKVLDIHKGNFYVSECLSVAPENAETGAGSGSSATTPGGSGGSGSGSGSGSTPGGSGGSGSGSGSGVGSGGGGIQGPGAAMDGYYSHDFTTDDNGLLHLQWTDPSGDNYISPGQYTVTEKIAPPGYNLSTESRHIVLNADGSFSGSLVFENDPLRRLRIKKVSMDNEPLAGAQFDIYRDGKLITSGTTDDNGEFLYSGENGIPDGLYHVVETAPPQGFLLPFENSQYVDIRAENVADDEVVTLTFKNYEDSIIRIKKFKEGTTVGLQGAVFEVQIEGETLGRFTSGPDGTVDITPETYGAFLQKNGWTNRTSWTVAVREVTPPDGYLLGDDQWQIAELHQGEILKEFIFEDIEYPKIEIMKRDTNTREPLAGATFDVMVDGHSIGDFTTGADGKIVIDYATYKRFLGDEGTDDGYTDKKLFDISVREKTAPEGYLIDDNGWQVKPLYRSQSPLVFEFNDTKYPEIWVRKIDHETGEPLAGMTFEVEIDGKKLNAQWTTTEEDVVEREGWHKITFEEYKEFLNTQGGNELDERGYTIKVTETSAPQFYNKDRQLGSESGADYTIVRQLNSNSSRVEFTFEDTHYRSLKVRKIDSETQWPLLGAEFTLKLIRLENQDLNASQPNGWGDGVSKVGKTNDQGEYVFENLPNGEYLLTETHAPQGYHGIDDTDTTKRGYWTDTRLPGSRTIVITSSSGSDGVGGNPDAANRVIEYTYANEPKSGIKIFKKDGVTGHSIEGARFRITPLSPLEEASWEEVTDSNGLIVIENDLKYGTYMIEELEVPAPYHVDHTPQYIELNDQHDAYSVTFNNYADGMVYIRKLDSKTGLPVAGARFEIRKADGTLLDDTLITGVDGYIDYGPLVPGESYVVTEIEAPPGYTISNPSVQPFTVPENASGWVKSLIFKDDPLCNLWLRKIDAETGLGLQGAVFEIRTGEGTIIRQNEVTDQQGYVKVDGLIEGSYIVRETKAPNGYMLDDSDHHVVLRSGQTEVVLIENTKPGGLVIYKIDAATKQPLEGAVFQLYDINDTPIGAPVKTGKDGYARWADLTPGQYQVEEITAPDGYQRTTGRRKFEVKEFNSITYEWPNAEEATITIYKRDGETLLPLGGAEFEIRDLNGSVVEKLVTDVSGSATSKKLPLGFYQVVETKAPLGYQLVEYKSDPIEVKAGSPVVIERDNWSDKTIIIRKRDVNTQQPLQGAWFELQTIDGDILQDAICTDASGVAVTKQVEPGQYYLVETKAPDGYRIIQEKILVTVESGKGVSVNIDNMPETIVEIYKTDEITGDPIPNTEFALKDKHGKVIEVLMTDITGWAYSQPLAAGDYCVVETQPAPGYVRDEEEHWIEVEEGKNFILQLKNMPGIHITVTKVDATEATGEGAASRKPLAGAVFELQTDSTTGDCKYIGTYTTDEYGKFQVEGLAPGFYRLYEKTAPDGYEAPEGTDAYTRICVKAENPGGASAALNEFVIENVRMGSLVVLKTDKNDNKPIAGAVFQLETVDGDFIGRKETDSNGEIIWSNLKHGFYVVKEIIAPDNYDPSNCPSQNVEIKSGKTTNITFRDEAYGSLVIILQDKHTGDYLEGGQFVVTRLSDMNIVFDSSTDITGTIVVGNLKPGWYEIVEKFSPDGYTIIESTQKVEIKLGIQQTIYYVNETSGLVIEKVDAQDTKILLEGARFKVTRVADNEVIGEYVTDKSGTALVSNLTPGYYKVEEIGAPLGYEIDDPEPKMVDVHGGLTGHVTFKDTARASITINVVDKDTQKGLGQCTVEVWRQNGQKVNEWTSDKTGMIETEKMTPGYYVLKLVKVVDGYKAVISEATVELKAGIETTYKFECTSSGSVTVVGKDENGNVLAGVKFRVTLADGTFIGDYVTGSDGTYDLSGLAPGNYIITWLAGPAGYEVITGTQNITITSNGNITVDIMHKQLSNLTIQVTDDKKVGIDNAKIEIWLQNGDLIKTVTTDKTGNVTVEGLEPGIYVVKLISWPDGFNPVEVEKTVTVTHNRTITVQFSCVESGSLTVKSTGNNNQAMAGVKFDLKDSNGVLIGSYETDSNGVITIKELEAGKYVITETSCEGGYVIPEENKNMAVEIKTGAMASVTLSHVAESNVTINVQDKNTHAGITGVRVEIWQQNGALVKTLVSDSTGVLNFGGLANGFYVVKIVNEISGYTAVISETTIEVKTGVSVNFTFDFVAAGGITVNAQDADGKLIPGVAFEVKTLSGTVIGNYTTDSTGSYVINGLDSGNYVITETSCPSDYNIDESTKSVTVEVKSGSSVTVTLKHTQLSELNIQAQVQGAHTPLQGVMIEIWQQNGSLVNSFTSGSDGRFVIDSLPNGFYVLKVITYPEGYTPVVSETTIEVKTGVKVDFTFEFVSDGILKVQSVDNANAAIVGMQFSVTDLNGTPVGNYTTGADGVYTFDSLNPGWYVITETKAPDGYVINEATKEQKVEVKAGQVATLTFAHSKIFGLQVRSTVTGTNAGLAGVTYKITTLDNVLVTTLTSNDAGIAFNALTPGWYVVVPDKAPAGYTFTDTTPKNVEVKADGLTVVDFTLNQAASMRIKVIDGTTGAGIYGVRLQLKNSAGECIKEYYTNDTGYVNLDVNVSAGGYLIEMISAPAGYIVDTMPHTIEAASGNTTEIVYKLYKEGGQIQVVVTSADANKTMDLPAGTPLEGAVFEIENPDTYQVVGQMISDSRGIAASAPLPIGRYTVKMINAPAYYAVNESFNPEVRIKINNDVVREAVTVKSANLKVDISQKTNTTAKAGSVIRVDVLTANNKSDTRLNNFYMHIKVPTDAARIVSINPGTWNSAVWYSISYKTNARDYTKIGANLSSENNYTFDLSSQSLGLMPAEYVTDIRFEFGTVPANFAIKTKTTYGLYIQNVPNGYKMISRIEGGGQTGQVQLTTNTNVQTPGLNAQPGGGQPTVGQSSSQWVTGTGMSTVTITNSGKLPKTGY